MLLGILFHVSVEPSQRSLNKRNHLLRSLVYTVTAIWLLCTSRWNTLNKKAIFIILVKLTQLAEDVALKVTLFRHLNDQQIGIMKLKTIRLFYILPLFLCFSGCVWWGFPLFPVFNDFLSSLRECEGTGYMAHTWELLLGVVSHWITGMSSQTSSVRDACWLDSTIFILQWVSLCSL